MPGTPTWTRTCRKPRAMCARALSQHLGDLRPARVGVAVHRLARLAPEELVHGHPGLSPLDVPQRHVDAADRVVEDGPVPPVRARVEGLPGVLDAVRGLADEEGLEVAIDRGRHEVGPLRERGAAVAVQAVLVRRDLRPRRAAARAGAVAIARTSVIFGDGRPRRAFSARASAAAARAPRSPAAEPPAASRNASRLLMRPPPRLMPVNGRDATPRGTTESASTRRLYGLRRTTASTPSSAASRATSDAGPGQRPRAGPPLRPPPFAGRATGRRNRCVIPAGVDVAGPPLGR